MHRNVSPALAARTRRDASAWLRRPRAFFTDAPLPSELTETAAGAESPRHLILADRLPAPPHAWCANPRDALRVPCLDPPPKVESECRPDPEGQRQAQAES